MTESRGHWIVEAVEAFEDVVNGEKVKAQAGERRIVAPNLLFKQRSLPPPVKEHAYELKMERKLRRLVQREEEKKQQ